MHWCPDATQNELWGLSQGVGKVVYGEKEPSKHKCGSAPASEVRKGHCWRERVESNISFRSSSGNFRDHRGRRKIGRVERYGSICSCRNGGSRSMARRRVRWPLRGF